MTEQEAKDAAIADAVAHYEEGWEWMCVRVWNSAMAYRKQEAYDEVFEGLRGMGFSEEAAAEALHDFPAVGK